MSFKLKTVFTLASSLIIISLNASAEELKTEGTDKLNRIGCTANLNFCYGDRVETKKGFNGRVQGHFKNGDVQLKFKKDSIRVPQANLSHRTHINPNFILSESGCNKTGRYCVGNTIKTKKGFEAKIIGFYDKTDVIKLQFSEDIINLHVTSLSEEPDSEWTKEPSRLNDSIYIKVENIALKGQCRHFSECFRMYVYVDGVLSATWITSPGKPHFNEKNYKEEGEYTPIWTNAKITRVEDETYQSRSYPLNDDGTRGGAKMPWAIFFKRGGIAIHGSFGAVDGKRRSHGCLRLSPEHAEILNRWVRTVGAERTTLTTRHTVPEYLDVEESACKANHNGHFQPYDEKNKRFVGRHGYGFTIEKECIQAVKNAKKAVCMWNGSNFQPHSLLTGRPVGKNGYGFTKLSRCMSITKASRSSVCTWTGKGYQPYSVSSHKPMGVPDFRFAKIEECAKTTNASNDKVCNWAPGSVWKVYRASDGTPVDNRSYEKLKKCIQRSK